MSKIDILKKKLANKKILILDGATGTELQRRGIETTLPLWSASDYIQSGADIIITNTFRTTERTFRKVNIHGKAKEATLTACFLAKQAIKESKTKRKVFIAGSIAPLEDCYSPQLTPSQEDLLVEHLEYAKNLKEGGVDFILIETMITLRETLAALEAVREVNMPVAVCFCCDENSNLLSGEDIAKAVGLIEPYNPLFIGVNCLSCKYVPRLIDRLNIVTSIPLCVYAQGNGQPDDKEGWKFSKNGGASWYAKQAKIWKEKGVQIIGGCCGTTPEYINKISSLFS